MRMTLVGVRNWGDNKYDPFAVVKYSCATDEYSFAHEIGHLFGAQHDRFTGHPNFIRSYGHGYVNLQENWRTIMAYDWECNSRGIECPRLLYWSNPNVNHPTTGSPMGVNDSENNVKAINEYSSHVENFYLSPRIVELPVENVSNSEIYNISATKEVILDNGFDVDIGAKVDVISPNVRLEQSFSIYPGTEFNVIADDVVECCSPDIFPECYNSGV